MRKCFVIVNTMWEQAPCITYVNVYVCRSVRKRNAVRKSTRTLMPRADTEPHAEHAQDHVQEHSHGPQDTPPGIVHDGGSIFARNRLIEDGAAPTRERVRESTAHAPRTCCHRPQTRQARPPPLSQPTPGAAQRPHEPSACLLSSHC
jgi:hypothetical protein